MGPDRGIWVYTTLVVVSLFAFFSSHSTKAAHASLQAEDFTFGFELTANTDQNPEYDIGKPVHGKDIDFVLLAAQRFAELTGGTMLAPTPDGEIPVKSGERIWRFENDGGVLEVACPVLRFHELGEVETIFQTFSDIGLRPEVLPAGKEGGGGHIHLGRAIFEQNPLLLRNFLVDVLNRPFIQGVLEEPGDDQALSLRDRKLDKALARELQSLDARFLKGEKITLEEVARTFVRAFGDGTDIKIPAGNDIYDWDARYSDINLTNLLTGKHPTVEVRLLRAPTSTAQVIARGDFFVRYLKSLNAQAHPISLENISQEQKQWRELPSVMRKNWHDLLDSLDLRDQIHEEEWTSRFKPLLHKTLAVNGRQMTLEVREGRSLADVYGIYELRLSEVSGFPTLATTAPQSPRIAVRIGDRTLRPKFFRLEQGVWLARLEVPEKWSPWKNEIKGFDFVPPKGSSKAFFDKANWRFCHGLLLAPTAI